MFGVGRLDQSPCSRSSGALSTCLRQLSDLTRIGCPDGRRSLSGLSGICDSAVLGSFPGNRHLLYLTLGAARSFKILLMLGCSATEYIHPLGCCLPKHTGHSIEWFVCVCVCLCSNAPGI